MFGASYPDVWALGWSGDQSKTGYAPLLIKKPFQVVVSNIFYPYLGKIPILTNIFQLGWNHQPALCS